MEVDPEQSASLPEISLEAAMGIVGDLIGLPDLAKSRERNRSPREVHQALERLAWEVRRFESGIAVQDMMTEVDHLKHELARVEKGWTADIWRMNNRGTALDMIHDWAKAALPRALTGDVEVMTRIKEFAKIERNRLAPGEGPVTTASVSEPSKQAQSAARSFF